MQKPFFFGRMEERGVNAPKMHNGPSFNPWGTEAGYGNHSSPHWFVKACCGLLLSDCLPVWLLEPSSLCLLREGKKKARHLFLRIALKLITSCWPYVFYETKLQKQNPHSVRILNSAYSLSVKNGRCTSCGNDSNAMFVPVFVRYPLFHFSPIMTHDHGS